jgi:hypothetical protein
MQESNNIIKFILTNDRRKAGGQSIKESAEKYGEINSDNGRWNTKSNLRTVAKKEEWEVEELRIG